MVRNETPPRLRPGAVSTGNAYCVRPDNVGYGIDVEGLMNVWLINYLPLHDGATSRVIGIFADEGSALFGVKHWMDKHNYLPQAGLISSGKPTIVLKEFYNYNRRYESMGGSEWLVVAEITLALHKVGTFLSEGEPL